jgi:hypothetical protein
MNVVCTVTDKLGSIANGATIVGVSSDPTVTIPIARPGVIDVRQTVTFSTSATAGSGSYVYAWSGLPTGCSSENSNVLSCSPSTAAVFRIEVSATDSNGFTVVSSLLTFAVNPDPAITGFSASMGSFDLGQAVTFVVSASGGTGPLSYQYDGLPSGCTSTDTTAITCTPSSSGNSRVAVTVADAAGVKTTAYLNITIANPPGIVSFTASSAGLDLGQGTMFTVTSNGGTAPFSYSYSGLPPGCSSSNTATLNCTPSATGFFMVGVTVSDAAGKTATASASVTVRPTVLGFSQTVGYVLIGGAGVGVAAAVGAVTLLVRRRRRTPIGSTNKSILDGQTG